MPKKELVRPGRFHPRLKDGVKATVDISYDRISHWHENSKKLAEKGYLFPIPYGHSDKALPIHRDDLAASKPGDYQYAGFYSVTDLDTDGKLDIEPEWKDDKSSNKAKGFKFLSLQTAPEFVDKDGVKYEDVIVHAALTKKPIHRNQDSLDAATLALSMSDFEDGDDDGAGDGSTNELETVLKLLAEHGLELPDDCSPETFLRDLLTALTAVASHKKQEGGPEEDLGKKPEGSKTKHPNTAIAMSEFSEYAVLRMSETAGTNPVTSKPWTHAELEAEHKAVLAAQPVLKFSEQQEKAFNLLQNNNKRGLVQRVKACVDSATMARPIGEELVERINAVELQFSDDGDIDEKTHGDIFLPLKMAESAPDGAALTGKTAKEISAMKFSLDTIDFPAGFEKPDADAAGKVDDPDKVAREVLAAVGA